MPLRVPGTLGEISAIAETLKSNLPSQVLGKGLVQGKAYISWLVLHALTVSISLSDSAHSFQGWVPFNCILYLYTFPYLGQMSQIMNYVRVRFSHMDFFWAWYKNKKKKKVGEWGNRKGGEERKRDNEGISMFYYNNIYINTVTIISILFNVIKVTTKTETVSSGCLWRMRLGCSFFLL